MMTFINPHSRIQGEMWLITIAALPAFRPGALALHPHALPMTVRAYPLLMDAAKAGDPSVSLDRGLVKTLRATLGRLNFGRRKKKDVLACGSTKYGCDPRTQDEGKLEENPADSSGSYPTFEAGVVGELTGGLAHLTWLLRETGDEKAVILKFKREGCPACNSTILPLASAAAAYADRALFLEVDYTRNRAFCKLCALAVVPCAHIYVDGKLVDATALGPRAWDKFAICLEERLGEPSSALVAAEIPPDKTDARSGAGLDIFM